MAGKHQRGQNKQGGNQLHLKAGAGKKLLDLSVDTSKFYASETSGTGVIDPRDAIEKAEDKSLEQVQAVGETLPDLETTARDEAEAWQNGLIDDMKANVEKRVKERLQTQKDGIPVYEEKGVSVTSSIYLNERTNNQIKDPYGNPTAEDTREKTLLRNDRMMGAGIKISF